VNALEARLEDVLEPMDVAVIGCVVNGPGEAREAEIGLAGGTPNLLYSDGKPDHKVSNEQLVDELEKVIRAKIKLRQELGQHESAYPVIPLKQIASGE